MTNKLWILKPIRDWQPPYDSVDGFVVRAPDEAIARARASCSSGDEGHAVWLDDQQTTCDELLADGDSTIILRSYNAG